MVLSSHWQQVWKKLLFLNLKTLSFYVDSYFHILKVEEESNKGYELLEVIV